MASSFYAGFANLHLNWFTGCEPSLPCWKRCWTRGMANRLKGRYDYPADEPFCPTFHDEAFTRPLPKKPSVIALNFMGDWALAETPDLWLMVNRIAGHAQHTFLTLTKRCEKLAARLLHYGNLPPNVWLGMSTFGKPDRAQWDALNSIHAAHYWLSYEPLVEAPELPLPLPHWVVAGCESGRGARWGGVICHALPESRPKDCNWFAEKTPCQRCTYAEWQVVTWLHSIRDQCKAANVPVWAKQMPVYRDGKWVVSSDLADFPANLQVKEKPL